MMATKKSIVKIEKKAEILPPGMLVDIEARIPDLNTLEGYSRLEVREQDMLRNVQREFFQFEANQIKGELLLGIKLREARDHLKTTRMWEKFLRGYLTNNDSRAKVYRIFDKLEIIESKGWDPMIVERVVMLPKISKQVLINAGSQPRRLDEQSIDQFVSKLQNRRSVSAQKAEEAPVLTVERLVKQCVLEIRAAYNRIPADESVKSERLRHKFILDVCTHALHIGKFQNRQTIDPSPFPTHWLPRKVGRPRHDEKRA